MPYPCSEGQVRDSNLLRNCLLQDHSNRYLSSDTESINYLSSDTESINF